MGMSITDVTWFILKSGVSSPTNDRPRHSDETLSDGNMRTSTLRITNVSMNDDAQYQCSPTIGVVSNSAFLTVLGEIIICKYIHKSIYICTCVTVYLHDM